MLPVALSQLIVRHNSVKECTIVVVDVVSIYHANNMILCSQTLTPNNSALLHDNGGGGWTSLLVFHLGIPGNHGIIITLPPPPPLSLVGVPPLP